MSHAATTWQSSDARKDLVLPGPCQPMPITPRLMRLLAEAPGICAYARKNCRKNRRRAGYLQKMTAIERTKTLSVIKTRMLEHGQSTYHAFQ
jgi:hypothetical protein